MNSVNHDLAVQLSIGIPYDEVCDQLGIQPASLARRMARNGYVELANEIRRSESSRTRAASRRGEIYQPPQREALAPTRRGRRLYTVETDCIDCGAYVWRSVTPERVRCRACSARQAGEVSALSKRKEANYLAEELRAGIDPRYLWTSLGVTQKSLARRMIRNGYPELSQLVLAAGRMSS